MALGPGIQDPKSRGHKGNGSRIRSTGKKFRIGFVFSNRLDPDLYLAKYGTRIQIRTQLIWIQKTA
jgi:hypothetical protein